MLKFITFVKDLFDLRKPVILIREKLALVGIVFVVQIIYYMLWEEIKGFVIYKSITWDFFVSTVIEPPILEGAIFWGSLYFLLCLSEIIKNPNKYFVFRKINLYWILILIIGITFGACHESFGGNLVVVILTKGFSGILYGWLVVKTRSIWPNIACHMLWNFAAIVFFK